MLIRGFNRASGRSCKKKSNFAGFSGSNSQKKWLISREIRGIYFMHQFFIGKLPKIFDSFFIKTSDKHNVNTRFATRTTFYVPKIRTNYGKFNIRYNGPTLWNETDERFKILTPYSFKRELSLHFINLY